MDVNKSVSTLMDPTCVPVEMDTDYQLTGTAVLVNCRDLHADSEALSCSSSVTVLYRN